MSVKYIGAILRRQVTGELDFPNWLAVHPRRSYIIAVALSTPPWVDRKRLRAIDAAAHLLTERTGRRYVVDHIVPVTHPYVCGLTVPWNLRVIPATANGAKGNSFAPDQVEAFTDPEQFSLI